MKIFITGGTGFVGSHIAQELLNRGHELVALVRRAGSMPGAGEIVGDVTRPETIPPEKLAGCQAAIHLVGIIREKAGLAAPPVTFKQVHVEGTRNVLETCKRAGIPRIIHQSALGKGYRSGALYQRTKAHAEDLVRDSGLQWTIFRPATILGQGGEFLEMMLTFTRLGVAPLPGGGHFLLAPLAIDTVVQAYANALERETAIGKTYELGGDTISYRALLEKIALLTGRASVGASPLKWPACQPTTGRDASTTGRDAPKESLRTGTTRASLRFINLPLGPLYALAALLDTFPFFPITQEQLIMLQESAAPRGDEAYRDLGLEYKGIDRVLEEVLWE